MPVAAVACKQCRCCRSFTSTLVTSSPLVQHFHRDHHHLPSFFFLFVSLRLILNIGNRFIRNQLMLLLLLQLSGSFAVHSNAVTVTVSIFTFVAVAVDDVLLRLLRCCSSLASRTSSFGLSKHRLQLLQFPLFPYLCTFFVYLISVFSFWYSTNLPTSQPTPGLASPGVHHHDALEQLLPQLRQLHFTVQSTLKECQHL